MPKETLQVMLALFAFGIFHSLTAAIGIKALFVTVMGQRGYLGLYRLFYNVVSTVTLLPVLALAAARPGKVIWEVEGIGVWVFLALQAIGVVGLVVSLLQIDGMRFLGLRQAVAYFAGEPLPLPAEPLSLGGVYALVRHPLYFFSLMAIWFIPTMHAATLGFNIGATIYFALGSLLEERKLVKGFGKDYVLYQKRVPWMIPFTKLPSKAGSATSGDSVE